MSKTIIAPIIAFLAIVASTIFHINIDADVQTQVVELVSQAVALGLVLDGIFRNHKK